MEIQLLTRMDHPCIVKLLDIIPPLDPFSFTEFYIILDYVESDMRRIVKDNISLDMVHIKTIMYNVLLGIKYMHQLQVVHRDLKPANILVKENCNVKLCDFGLSRAIIQ